MRQLLIALAFCLSLLGCQSFAETDPETKKLIAQATMLIRQERMMMEHAASTGQPVSDSRRRYAVSDMMDSVYGLFEKGNREGAEAFLEFLEGEDFVTDQELVNVRGRIKAAAAKELAAKERGDLLEASLAAVNWDAENALDFLGFTGSQHLFDEQGVNFYLAKEGPRPNSELPGYLHFVALHDVPDDVELLELVDDTYNPDGTFKRYSYSDKVNGLYGGLCARLEQASPGALQGAVRSDLMHIDHYTHGRGLLALKSLHPRQATDRVLPLMRTSYLKPSDGSGTPWKPYVFSSAEGGTSAPIARTDANRFSTAHQSRLVEALDVQERRRVASLSPTQKAKEAKSNRARNFREQAERRRAQEQEQRRLEQVRKDEMRRKYEALDPELRAKAEAEHLVYRDWSYWSRFNYPEALRGILNGTTRQVGYEGDLPYIHQEFISTYFEACGDLLPPGSPGYDITIIDVVTMGLYRDETPRETVEFRMHPRMLPKYDDYSDNLTLGTEGGLLETIKRAQDWGAIQEDAAYLLGMKSDSARIFRLEGCRSGFIQQFEENLYRISNGLPPVQSEPYRLDYLSLDQ